MSFECVWLILSPPRDEQKNAENKIKKSCGGKGDQLPVVKTGTSSHCSSSTYSTASKRSRHAEDVVNGLCPQLPPCARAGLVEGVGIDLLRGLGVPPSPLHPLFFVNWCMMRVCVCACVCVTLYRQ